MKVEVFGSWRHRRIVRPPTATASSYRSGQFSGRAGRSGAAISFPTVLLMARGDDLHVASNAHLVALALALVGSGALATVCGVAIGSILRHQTAAMVLILVWTLLVEKLFGGFFPPVLPFGAILAAVGLAGDDGPSILASLSVLAAWAGALIVAANRTIKFDVT